MMVHGIFTGKVRLDYARHRHSLWLKEIEQEHALPAAVSDETKPSAKTDPPAAAQPIPQQETQQPAGEKIQDKNSAIEDEEKPPQTCD
ncbi:MAG: hypothetical protein CVU51_00950 [Deltaproteobacteria bacterium HGW-Deltaproteobacteria-1]|jgi:hypothetical protein|nr:MAG: hypothetical protein CVU51_00950 [Deltaproteobacteria bacterium HGW-Deltaproteobacteria-1]